MAKTLLLTDDEPDIRRIAGFALSAIGGWNVLQAASGAEAIALAEKHAPAVILLDVMMPSMDGPATLIELRQSAVTAAIPVIFMTAKVRAQDLDRLLSLGVQGVIQKPFDPMTLSMEVERVLHAATSTPG